MPKPFTVCQMPLCSAPSATAGGYCRECMEACAAAEMHNIEIPPRPLRVTFTDVEGLQPLTRVSMYAFLTDDDND